MVDNNPPNEVFLDWVRANAAVCTHEEMQQALADTEHACRRPRRLVAEYAHVWARSVFFATMQEYRKQDAGVRVTKTGAGVYATAEERLGVSERTVWAALKPPPPAPSLTEERLRQILADNIEIAQRSGNVRTVELLRRIDRHFLNTVRCSRS